MSGYARVLPLKMADGKAFYARMLKRVNMVKEEVQERALEELEQILRDILSNSPRYTGASSGDPGPYISRVNYPSHPAYEYRHSIGNYFNGGLSGWQVEVKKINQHRKTYSLTNAMYTPYLRYVHSANQAIRAAWVMHLARRT